jgi:hypothetical protein
MIRATTLAKWWQKCQCNNSDVAIAMTTKMPEQIWHHVVMPVQWQQRGQRNKGNDASATPAKMPAWWGQQFQGNASKDASKMLAKMLAQQWQQRQRNNGKDPGAMGA